MSMFFVNNYNIPLRLLGLHAFFFSTALFLHSMFAAKCDGELCAFELRLLRSSGIFFVIVSLKVSHSSGFCLSVFL